MALLSDEMPMGDWLPMSSAPKNGSDILIFDQWCARHHMFKHIDFEIERIVQVYWSPKEDRWVPRTDRRENHTTTATVIPVCWQPLLKLPGTRLSIDMEGE